MVRQSLINEFSPPDHTERGFSIIEMVIAMAVLTFGLVSIVGISAYVSRANTISNNLSVLATAAQDQVDRLRKVRWTIGNDNDPTLSVGGTISTGTSTSAVDKTTPASSGSGVQTYGSGSTQGQSYVYKQDTQNPHRATVAGTPAGDLQILWQVTAGPGTTGDVRTVTIRVVQINPPPHMAEGYTVTTIIHRN